MSEDRQSAHRELINAFMRTCDRAKYAGTLALRSLAEDEVVTARRRLDDAVEDFNRGVLQLRSGGPLSKPVVHHPDCQRRAYERGRWTEPRVPGCTCGAMP